MKRQEVYDLINEERDYQDSLRENGTFKIQEIRSGEEILMIEEYGNLARKGLG